MVQHATRTLGSKMPRISDPARSQDVVFFILKRIGKASGRHPLEVFPPSVSQHQHQFNIEHCRFRAYGTRGEVPKTPQII